MFSQGYDSFERQAGRLLTQPIGPVNPTATDLAHCTTTTSPIGKEGAARPGMSMQSNRLAGYFQGERTEASRLWDVVPSQIYHKIKLASGDVQAIQILIIHRSAGRYANEGSESDDASGT